MALDQQFSQDDQIIRKNYYYRSIKRFADIIFSLSILLVGFPFFLLFALLVKLSSVGPVFYVQERVGRNFSRFGCIKFRTMHPEAEDILNNLLEENSLLKEEFQKDFKLRNDPRITSIGKFLRRTSLDELPQFFNVLRGEMSVVGPRPIVPEEVERYGEFMEEVNSVRPGITGLWQISGRNNLSYKRRISLDLVYVRQKNIWMDFRIIMRTFFVLLFPIDRGAY
ncbi:sugar transferase [Prochlorococcus marinus]|uniref:Sugar transferases involved in lipopolysaccharide synthesis n=1 Tax=Prochlorococcus marinus (strain MIT 9211) TaxID=93059 RepID=A9BBT4_PROM4|nr:sugar transferase [Prochlorococcus marinus]ABX09296.1 Sugar transferases involved in lipopolysaccharide synthesis [Prochlorococcus marinus str. MIT 9211]